MSIGNFEINSDVIRQFEQSGAVCLRGLFDRKWCDLAHRGIQRNLEHPSPLFRDHTPDGSPGRYVFDFWNWQKIPEFELLIFQSPAGAIAGQLMQSRQSLMIMDNWFMREKGATNGAPWHHDEPYFDFEGRMCILWFAMEPVSRENGLTFIKGSHRWNKLFIAPQFSENVPFICEGDGYSEMPNIDAHSEDYDFLSWDLDVGDCLVFDIRTIHGATSSSTPLGQTVKSMSLRFGTEDTIFRPRGAWTQEITDHLISLGQKVDQPLDCSLLPCVWEAEQS